VTFLASPIALTSLLIRRGQGVRTFVKQRVPKPICVGIQERRARLEQLCHATMLKRPETACGTMPVNVQPCSDASPMRNSCVSCGFALLQGRCFSISRSCPSPSDASSAKHDYARTPHHDSSDGPIHVTSADHHRRPRRAARAITIEDRGRLSPLLMRRTMFFDRTTGGPG
jgi:hypothetical protein